VKRITYGADPELFIQEAETGAPFPICGLLGGTKHKPRMVQGYGLQEDNVMAEYTVPVAPSMAGMIGNACGGWDLVQGEIRNKRRGLRVTSLAVATFTNEALSKAGPQAMEFGCSPDFDGYDMGRPHPPVDIGALMTEGGALRFAGGHIHIGYKDICPLPEFAAALFCDATFGIGLVRAGERQFQRRGLYGMAGRFRPTAYGVEYRTPSNAWLFQRTMQRVLTETALTFEQIIMLPQPQQMALYHDLPWADIKQAINTEDRTLAESLHRNVIAAVAAA
jgi:hypothetical protein